MPKTKILNRSRRKSYGKKVSARDLTGRKQRALERARVREVKAVEKVTPPERKIPGRGPRSKPDPGTYAVRALFQGGMGCGTLLFAFVFLAASVIEFGLPFLIIGLLFMAGAVHSFLNSRGAW